MITHTCHIVVSGANGGIGLQVVLAALKSGHTVTAIVRTPSNLQVTHPNLRIVQGDVMKPRSLDNHLEGKDVIISAIGRNSFKKTTLYSEGSRNIIEAMKRAETNRIFFISVSGLEANPSHSVLVQLATKFILQTLLRNMYADLWRMEKMVKNSSTRWTIIRPPKLINCPETGRYRISIDKFLNNSFKISRADIAHFIITNLSNEAIVNKVVEIAY